MASVEQVLRYVDLTPEQSSRLPIGVSVANGQPVEPMRVECPTGLAITRTGNRDGTETYVLYFLRDNGGIIDFAQRTSLQRAMAEVGAVVTERGWHVCSLELDEERFDRIPRDRLTSSCSGP